MSGNGSRFPMGPPPGMPRGGAPLAVASPQTDFQLVCWMAAMLLAQEPAAETPEGRNQQADLAATRAVEVFGHCAFRLGRGVIEATARQAVGQGQDQLRAAIENEPTQEPARKIVTDEGGA